jgi:hypothetical protein
VCHAAGVPLLVDEAHGAHFGLEVPAQTSASSAAQGSPASSSSSITLGTDDGPASSSGSDGAARAGQAPLPPSAMQLGADIAVQSTHKMLSAMTQAAMLHLAPRHVHSPAELGPASATATGDALATEASSGAATQGKGTTGAPAVKGQPEGEAEGKVWPKARPLVDESRIARALQMLQVRQDSTRTGVLQSGKLSAFVPAASFNSWGPCLPPPYA